MSPNWHLKDTKAPYEMVIIPEYEYLNLKESALLLSCLKGCAVEEWEHYNEALDRFYSLAVEAGLIWGDK